MPGHHVLAVPVPELEDFVRGRWQHYDARWVSSDPAFTHAHVTALSPFPVADSDLVSTGSTNGGSATDGSTIEGTVAEIAATTAPFAFELAKVATFPNGCIHLPPHPSEPFAELTRRLVAAFPGCPPYGGEYDAVPHLTLDQRSSTVTEASTRAALAGVLPVRCRADRLELHWYEEGRCHVVRAWSLAGASVPGYRGQDAGSTSDTGGKPWPSRVRDDRARA